MLFLGWVAMIAYWLIYFLIIKKNNSTVQYGTTLTFHVPIDTTVNPFNPPEENNDEDEKAMRSLFNETMNGPEGKKLSKSYDGERGDKLLEISGALEYMQFANGYGRKHSRPNISATQQPTVRSYMELLRTGLLMNKEKRERYKNGQHRSILPLLSVGCAMQRLDT